MRQFAALGLMLIYTAAGLSGASDFPEIQMKVVVDGLAWPTSITHAGDGTGRLFVLEQAGLVRIIDHGVLQAKPFLDIRDRVTRLSGSCCDERGLLGIAFPPNYKEKKYFYLYYTGIDNGIIVSRFSVGDDPDQAEPASETMILQVEHFYENHFGGHLAFSPVDGKLYLSVGDGAGGDDPLHSGQNPTGFLGKILRIDVENNSREVEIAAMGLRNPWRFSFDRATGDMYIGDVGENSREEINFLPAGIESILNFGWSRMEGSLCLDEEGCDDLSLTPPIIEYTHEEGCAVTGGNMYRGSSFPELNGIYLYADFCSGKIWEAAWRDGKWESYLALPFGHDLSAFGEDEAGEVYGLHFTQGVVYQIVVPMAGAAN
ncbi:MAG: PQQ-dependent sugar dehydrogenase [Acidobacteriia bacterium]|nr:PQQ-dependent sugar dehydrogenase [Terriglobia bacterium]